MPFPSAYAPAYVDSYKQRIASATRYIDAISFENLMLDMASQRLKVVPEKDREQFIQDQPTNVRFEVIKGAMLTTIGPVFDAEMARALAPNNHYTLPPGLVPVQRLYARENAVGSE
ncbi:MAG: hypothetical protein ACI9YR_002497 [Bacteroidia bacterium]|jgi:hypothetical protein